MFRSATFTESICILPYYHHLLPLCQSQSVDAIWPLMSSKDSWWFSLLMCYLHPAKEKRQLTLNDHHNYIYNKVITTSSLENTST